METDDRKTIRGIDDAVFTESKAMAARKKMTLGQYITEALRAQNQQEGRT